MRVLLALCLLVGSSDLAFARWQPTYEPRPYYGGSYYGGSYYGGSYYEGPYYGGSYYNNRIYRPYGPHSPTNLSNRDAVKRAVIRFNSRQRYHHHH